MKELTIEPLRHIAQTNSGGLVYFSHAGTIISAWKWAKDNLKCGADITRVEYAWVDMANALEPQGDLTAEQSSHIDNLAQLIIGGAPTVEGREPNDFMWLDYKNGCSYNLFEQTDTDGNVVRSLLIEDGEQTDEYPQGRTILEMEYTEAEWEAILARIQLNAHFE